jgi:hypothetical protein
MGPLRGSSSSSISSSNSIEAYTEIEAAEMTPLWMTDDPVAPLIRSNTHD